MGQNLYCPGQSVLSEEGRENWENIKWDEQPDQEFIDSKEQEEECEQ